RRGVEEVAGAGAVRAARHAHAARRAGIAGLADLDGAVSADGRTDVRDVPAAVDTDLLGDTLGVDERLDRAVLPVARAAAHLGERRGELRRRLREAGRVDGSLLRRRLRVAAELGLRLLAGRLE